MARHRPFEYRDSQFTIKRILRKLEKISRDTQGNKTGFPDLIRFPDTPLGYELVEVKGPGDALQKNQKRWMAYFVEWGVPFKVLNVSWR